MIRLFEAYLNHCEDKDADPFYQILAFADVSIVSDQPSTADDLSADLLFIRRVKYSVQPSSTTSSQWLAGNGIWDGEWMIGKSYFAGVRVTGTLYELVILGTG